MEDLFNLTFPPMISGARSKSAVVDIDDDCSLLLTVCNNGVGVGIESGKDDCVFPFNLFPPKNVTALAVLTTDRETDIGNVF